MNKDRLEAFSDGVIAIIITLMVFKIEVPQDSSWGGLSAVMPSILTFLLSFVYLGIYWNNHHHLLQATERVSGRTLWANLHLLFWLSLLPFATNWMYASDHQPLPVSTYGFVLLMAAVAYRLLELSLVRLHGQQSPLRQAVGRDRKSTLTLAMYAAAVVIGYWQPMVAIVTYAMIALWWTIPDRRIEQLLFEAGVDRPAR